MKMNDFNKFIFALSDLISIGNIEEAKRRLAFLRENLDKHVNIKFSYASFAIDIGIQLPDVSLLDHGIAINEELKENLEVTDNLYPDCCYNLANGITEKIKLKWGELRHYLPGNSLVEEAKRNYREALNLTPDENQSKPSIYVNYGNLLNRMTGRTFEAFEAYEKALELDPNFAMALANKGNAQSYFANVWDEDTRCVLLCDAYSNVKKSISIGLEYGPRIYFEKLLEDIRNLFENPEQLDQEVVCDKRIKTTKNKYENYYRQFSHRERLYLNPLDKNHQCKAALYDPLRVNQFLDKIDEERFYEFADYINIIKQEYVLARHLAIQSFYKDKNLAFLDNGVSLVNTLDYQALNIYLELAKASFRSSFSILDKIAYVFNEYLNLGLNPKKLYFRNLSQLKNNKIREILSSIENPYISAITDLANDFENKYFEDIVETRNAMEHRLRLIHLDYGSRRWNFKHTSDSENTSQELTRASDLRKTVIDMLRLTKAAIFYLVLMIELEERKKIESIKDERIGTMIFQEIPDHLKID